ncbi:DUF6491 family protein [Marinimicrobium sp. ABcell2]|uniref:DUF6491 family protein n=1 Tax=Marinimicrobium sp. ABcell2 TaxID=3069751 RepID=UPI0027B304CE|nr:DUF6491 family protein [Marinimicrobium sp. ABcell2]MDQ2075199.1 DUF6491 family protein [Marinimicrobium sp. ABcell2]
MTIKTVVLSAGMVLVLSACGLFGREEVPTMSNALLETTGQNGRACVRSTDIRGYGVLKHDVMSIDGRRNYYLATMLPGCQAMGTTPRAGFESDFGEVCGGGRGTVHIGGEECTIRHLFRFDNRQEAFAAHEQAVELRREARERGE